MAYSGISLEVGFGAVGRGGTRLGHRMWDPVEASRSATVRYDEKTKPDRWNVGPGLDLVAEITSLYSPG